MEGPEQQKTAYLLQNVVYLPEKTAYIHLFYLCVYGYLRK